MTCPSTTLASGAEMTCTASGTAAEGDYENTGTVTAVGSAGTPVTDDDPSHYYGVVSEIHVEKFTNGVDADTPTGPNIPVGSPVTWTYQVTNPGNVRITNVALVDDKGVTPRFVSGDANGDDELQPGEIWLYEANGTASAGQYVNVATVTGLDQLEDPVTDSDPSHFISEAIPPPLPPPSTGALPETGAQRPRLVLRKRAGSARVRAGRRVNYQLRVRNTGSGTANRVRVCDRLPRGLVFATTRGAQRQGPPRLLHRPHAPPRPLAHIHRPHPRREHRARPPHLQHRRPLRTRGPGANYARLHQRVPGLRTPRRRRHGLSRHADVTNADASTFSRARFRCSPSPGPDGEAGGVCRGAVHVGPVTGDTSRVRVLGEVRCRGLSRGWG